MDYFYCAVRTDIPLADQFCQIAHACIEAGKRFAHRENANVVLLQVASRGELLKLWSRITSAGVRSFVHFEPDDDLQECAIATAMVSDDERQLFRHYRTWREPSA